jgi:enediyne biosynthesis protein E4
MKAALSSILRDLPGRLHIRQGRLETSTRMFRRGLVLSIPLLAIAAALADGPIVFEEITERAGVKFTSNNSPTPQKQQPQGLISGVAVFDYDGDGFPDLYFVNGANVVTLKKDGPQFTNRLYRNNGNLTFTETTDKAGVGGEGYGKGVSVGDYDNDGRLDVYVCNVNGNQLFHNNGNGTFTDVTGKAGVAGGKFNGKKMWSVAAAWVDYDNDGLLDLFVSNYCQWDPANEPKCAAAGQPVYCSPRHYQPLPHTLYHNNGNGTFTDVSAAVGLASQPGRGMGVNIADYDDDGFQDIFVANDDAPFQLFHNLGGKKFEEVALNSGVAFAESGNVISGMGSDFRDIFNTGRPSLWVTAVEKEAFPLFVNLARWQIRRQDVEHRAQPLDLRDVGVVQRDHRPRQRRMEGPDRRQVKRAGQHRSLFPAPLRRTDYSFPQPGKRAVQERHEYCRTRPAEVRRA